MRTIHGTVRGQPIIELSWTAVFTAVTAAAESK
jgi:hypothetical protein